uniref:NR LBD domain-containing protein n=1 Tax=Panagrellus redivivus TaxID=6233 RepID=A0A7E4VN98_PANRE
MNSVVYLTPDSGPSLSPYVLQKWTHTNYRVNSLLKEWKQLQHRYKYPLTTNIPPATKQLITVSLQRLRSRINNSISSLGNVLEYTYIVCVIYQLDHTTLLRHPRTGVNLKEYANRIINAIDNVIDALLDRPRVTPLKFKKLPYEFQSRLVALLPPRDLVAFKISGKTALNSVNQRGMFSQCLYVTSCNANYQDVKAVYGNRPHYDIMSTSFFLKLSSHFVQDTLKLNMKTPENFDRAVEILSGDYFTLVLRGHCTWKHAIHFMNLSKTIKFVILGYEVALRVEEFDGFFEAVVLWLQQMKHVVLLKIECHHLNVSFESRFAVCVESQTTFKVYYKNRHLVAHKKPQI